MRFASTTLSAPSATGAVTVTPSAGANWSILTPAQSLNMANALETFLAETSSAKTFGASIVGTAGAGNKAIAELQNPAASGKNLWVYVADLFVPVAMAVNLFLAGTTLNPAGTGFNLNIGGAVSTGKVGGGNQLAPTGNLIYTSPALVANTIFALPQPWVVQLPQGTNMQFQGQTVNQAFTCNLRWVEI